jgi:hypothetical protein
MARSKQHSLVSRRKFLGFLVAGFSSALAGGFLLVSYKSASGIPIGDGLIVIDGWILRTDEAAAVFT